MSHFLKSGSLMDVCSALTTVCVVMNKTDRYIDNLFCIVNINIDAMYTTQGNRKVYAYRAGDQNDKKTMRINCKK